MKARGRPHRRQRLRRRTSNLIPWASLTRFAVVAIDIVLLYRLYGKN
jgi:hypothetical protein